MQIFACNQVRGSGDHAHVGGRDVGSQINHAARQRDVRQIMKTPCQRFGLAQAHQPHARRFKQFLDHRRIGGHHKQCGIDLACDQRIGGCHAGERQQGRVRAQCTTGLQHVADQRPRAAALRAGGNAFACQLGEQCQLTGIAIKNPQRFVINRRQRHHAVILAGRGDAALDHCDVDAGFFIGDAFEVFDGTGGWT